MSINRAIITGNLTRDPEMRQTSGGSAVLSFSVAVNDRVKNPQTGEWENRPNYIDCTMFGTRAQGVSQYLSKGIKVSVEGRLHWSQFEVQGQKRTKVEVWVDELELMSRQEGAQATQGRRQAPQQPAPYYDEEIPF